QRGTSGGQARFRLRQIGAGDLTRGEAVARLAQRRLQDFHVVALELEQRRVAQQIHVGGGGAEQDGLLGGAQGLARGEYLALGQPRAAGGLEAIEKGLLGRQPVARNRDGPARLA